MHYSWCTACRLIRWMAASRLPLMGLHPWRWWVAGDPPPVGEVFGDRLGCASRACSRGSASKSSTTGHISDDLDGKCLNCLSSSHRVSTCKLPQCCLQWRGFQHITHGCRRPRHAGNRIPSSRALVRSIGSLDLGGSCGHGGATTPRPLHRSSVPAKAEATQVSEASRAAGWVCADSTDLHIDCSRSSAWGHRPALWHRGGNGCRHRQQQSFSQG